MNKSDIREKLGIKPKVKAIEKKFIYFLKMDGVVVYIGQSSSLESRLRKHSRDKQFDDFDYIECLPEDANNLEAENIVRHNPKYNWNLPKNDLYKSEYCFKSTVCESIAAMIREIKPQHKVKTDWVSHTKLSNTYSVEQIKYAKLKIEECCTELVLKLHAKEFK